MVSINYIKKILTAIVLFVFFLVCSPDITANITGRWVQHPAAALRSKNKESQVDRILEGPRFVYFSVRGAALNRYMNYLQGQFLYSTLEGIDPIQIFRYDKTLPWEQDNIRPLAWDYELSGTMPLVIEYFPGQELFVAIYEDNAVDLIYDDGNIVHSSALVDLTVPGKIYPYSVTIDEDGNKIYVGCSFGYISIDTHSGEIVDYVNFGKAVAMAGRVGDQMIVFAGTFGYGASSCSTETYIFQEKEVPSALENPVSGGTNALYLMPMTDHSFAALVRGSADTANTLRLFTISDGNVTYKDITGTLTVDNGSHWYYRHLFRTDGYVAHAKDGYAIGCNTAVYLLKKGEFEAENLIALAKPSTLTTEEKKGKTGTYDGSRIWMYYYDTNGYTSSEDRGFYYYEVDGSVWKGEKTPIAPNAPFDMFSPYGEHNPVYGLLLRGHGTYSTFEERVDIDRLGSYKEGKWIDRSYAPHNTAYIAATYSPKNVNFDPLNPSQVWGNSNFTGLHRIDMEDYSKYFAFGFEKQKGYENTYPGYHNIFPNIDNGWWNSFMTTSNMAFDSGGNMWFTHFWFTDNIYYDYEEITEAFIPLYYLTPEERANLDTEIPDIRSREIRIPRNMIHVAPKILGLSFPSNEHRIAISCNTYVSGGKAMVLYDHNGTPGDTEDDRYAEARDMVDERGDRLDILWESGLYEDPKTGELWSLTSSGPYIINPDDFLNGSKVCRRVKVTKKFGVDCEDYPLEWITINNIADDNLGRKWLATEAGLYCLSDDATELLGLYTKETTPLPSNNVWNVIFNPETNSLFTLTDRGIAEFRPDDSVISMPQGNHLTIWPSVVTPAYKGYINISGAHAGSDYAVYGKDGTEICHLGAPEDSMLQWDATGEDGNRVMPGKYNVKRIGSEENHPITVVE